MRKLLIAIAALACLISSQSFAADPIPVSDPEKFANKVIEELGRNGSSAVADRITRQVGRPEGAGDMRKFLQFFDNKKFDYSRKVIDHDYGGALRQIVIYSYVKAEQNSGFMYFRFNYKMSSAGWILANFAFKDETNELFPKDWLDR